MDAQPSPKEGTSTAPNIYRYDDFRLFLKDSFQAKKDLDAEYSYRKFAREAGLSNPGYLLDVIVGKRTFSDVAFVKTVKAFELDEAETEFFRLLVDFGQCKKEGQRQEYYQEILYRRNRSRFARLSPKLVKYYQDYHYPLVRCAIALKKYVRDLCEWELVYQNAEGRYIVTESFVEPPATMAALVRRLNREWILQAADAPFKFSVDDRHVSTLLLMVSEATRKIVRDKIEAFRQEVLQLVDQDKGSASGIMQLSLQFFPKTKKRK
jgi:hypothetical protein